MSAVSESVAQRMTLGYLTDRFGWQLHPDFARTVTVTSLADTLDSVTPGALFLPSGPVGRDQLTEAMRRGAYAAVVPHAMRQTLDDTLMPVLFGEPSAAQLGALASDITGAPSNVLAVFAVTADSPQESGALAATLADFLHVLGNPVGLISASGSRSLERDLELVHPLGILDTHRTMAVCAEDGVAAMVVSLDPDTFRPDAMQAVGVDVIGSDSRKGDVTQLRERYGFLIDEHVRLTRRGDESDAMVRTPQLASQTANPRRLSLAIAMALAAGVRKTNIRNALRVAQELR